MRLSVILVALIFCSRAFSQSESFETLLDAGYEYYLDETYEEAISKFNEAIKMSPNEAEAYYLRGVCLSSIDKKREALTDFNKATDIDPTYAAAYYEKGFLYLTDKNAELAIREFDTAIEFQADFAEAYVSRGTAKCMVNDKEGATADWEKARVLGIAYTEYMLCE